jgi:beta-lactam-binding protein with PASTA domain
MSKLKVNVRVSQKLIAGGRGTVIEQDPKAFSRVKCGYSMDLVIGLPTPTNPGGLDRGDRGGRVSTGGGSSGSTYDGDDVGQCEVPNLLGSKEESARLRLSKLKVSLKGIYKKQVATGVGTVVDQSPKPGNRPCPYSMELWIGEPQRIVEVPPDPTPEPICTTTVPRLIGRPEGYASKAIPGSQLRIGNTQTQNSAGPAGLVLDQKPNAGARVQCGTLVHLLIATPIPVPPTKDCEVPQVVRADVEQAKVLVERAGLKVHVARGDDGVVSAQSPPAGTWLKCGSRVDVAVVEPVTPCRVPDISGIDINLARQRLADRNLVLGNVRQRQVDLRPGLIVDQSARPGEVIPCRSQVDVWIAAPISCPPVPHVVGQDPKVAAVLLERAGYEVGTVSARESDQPNGAIVEQAPIAGSNVRCGTPIALWIATSAPPIRVPELIGRSAIAARDTLERLGLALGEAAERPSDAAPGTVVDQFPRAGTLVKRGSAVQVALAAPQPITVPDLRGRDRQGAAETLMAVRLRLGTVAERQSDDGVGGVIEQLPRPGTIAAPGTPVQIWIGIPRPIAIPDLRGRDRNAAVEALNAARLRLGEVGERASDATAGLIVDQLPRAGTIATAGTPVQVWVAVARPSTVPDLIGRERNAAAEALSAARLRFGEIGERQSDATAGLIVDQLPKAGTIATAGTPVQVWVAVARPSTVPDLVGRDRTVAAETLTAARLKVGEIEERQSDAAGGTIVEQMPRAGSTAAPGSPVQLWIAVPRPTAVPDLRGRDRQSALDTLTSARLRPGQITYQPSEAPQGTVISQMPQPGERVIIQSAVSFTIARPLRVIVPSLQGLDRAAATGTLTQSRLSIGTVLERATTEAPGTIVDQRPVPGQEVDAGTPVSVWFAVAVPVEMIAVPDLSGRSRAEAERIAAASRLVIGGTTNAELPNTPPGTIVRQQPAAGTQVPPQTPVDVVVAVGLAPVIVPSVAGLSVADAHGVLRSAGLQPGALTYARAWTAMGTVTGQSPQAGVSVPTGATVDLVAASSSFTLFGVLGGLLAGLGAAGTVSKFRRHRLPSSVAFAPHADSGVQVSVPDDGPDAEFEFSLQAFPDSGVQTLRGVASGIAEAR